MIINKTMFGPQIGMSVINRMNQRMDELQVQLGTGERTQTLAGLGNKRLFDLSLRSRLSGLEAYGQNQKTAGLRLDLMDTALSRLDKIEADARTSASPGGYGTDGINLLNLPALSKTRLDEVISLLNTNVAGRYLFSGSDTESKPVANLDAILNGEGGRAGFRTVAGERLLADRGDDDLGRLDIAGAGATTSLVEDGSHPFGYKLSTVSTDSSAVTLTSHFATQPRVLSVEFTAQPIAGQRVTIGMTLPDGTETGITLTAVTGTPANPGEFQIGATLDATATNFAGALRSSLEDETETSLRVASAYAAADNFFNGQGEAVLRIGGPPPYETATALVGASAANTMFWYSGEDSAAARDTVKVKVDDGVVASYGAQANEHGFVELIRSLAVSATQTFPGADQTSRDRFDLVARRQNDRLAESANNLPGSIEAVTLELGLARSAIGAAKERHTAYTVQLDTALADIEQVTPEEVAMEMLALKTRLEASYMSMQMVSQLSLVNYLG